LETLVKIKELADQQPYHKYNGMWSRQLESFCFGIVYSVWFRTYVQSEKSDLAPKAELISYDQVAKAMGSKNIPAEIHLMGSSNRRRRNKVSSQH
jgi:Translin family